MCVSLCRGLEIQRLSGKGASRTQGGILTHRLAERRSSCVYSDGLFSSLWKQIKRRWDALLLIGTIAPYRFENAYGAEISYPLLASNHSPPHTKMTHILLHDIRVHGRLFCHLKVLNEFIPFSPIDGICCFGGIQRG